VDLCKCTCTSSGLYFRFMLV